jgi:hypothetical protein
MAQEKLQRAFGMELVELPSRAGMEQDLTQTQTQDATLGTGIKKKGSLSSGRITSNRHLIPFDSDGIRFQDLHASLLLGSSHH